MNTKQTARNILIFSIDKNFPILQIFLENDRRFVQSTVIIIADILHVHKCDCGKNVDQCFQLKKKMIKKSKKRIQTI